MKQASEIRRYEVLQKDGSWVAVQTFGQIDEGDVVRAFEPDGTPVEGPKGHRIFTCSERAKIKVEDLV